MTTTGHQTEVRAAVVARAAAGEFTPAAVVPADLAPGEVLVQVRAAGLCRSDWNFVGQDNGNPYPALLGHELAGVVAAVGAGVTDLKVGDHVVGCGVPSCGTCENCRDGRRVWCLNPERTRRPADAPARMSTAAGEPLWQFMGIGAFAEQTVIHESLLVAVDPRIPFDRAAVLGCAVATGAGAVIRCAEVRPRESVVVIGAGGVGLNAIQAAVLVGARKVIAVDVSDEKLEIAHKFGATHVVNSSTTDPVAAVAEITDGRGVDHAFEMTGLAEPTRQGYAMLGRNGTLYIVGMQKPGSRFELPISGMDLGRGTAVRMVLMGSANFKVDIPYYAELYLQGRFNLDDLVAEHIDLADIDAGYARLLGGSGIARSVITFA